MKKFWIVLLSLGLVAAFALPAAAVEVKIAGSYFIHGIYENNRSLIEPGSLEGESGYYGSSMAYFGQRLRLEPVFKVAEGLNLNMRIDAMERVWGQERVGEETTGSDTPYEHMGSSRNLENEQNIQFRRVWVDFVTPVGMFVVGYMGDGAWGTDAFDLPTEGPTIVYVVKLGPVILAAVAEKAGEGRLGSVSYSVPANGYVDSDIDKYCLGGTFLFPQGTFQLLYCRVNLDNLAAPQDFNPGTGIKIYYNMAATALKATFGSFYIEAELQYQWGKAPEFQDDWMQGLVDAPDDIDYEAWQWYVNMKYNFGPAWVGVQYAHSSGDDPESEDTSEAVLVPGYGMWQPCLILFEDWTNRWAGNLGYAGSTTHQFANADLYQVYAGWNPTPKITVKASYTWAYADETHEDWADDEYGQEFDITGSIKIFDNLTYMVGFAYLWTGDYYKGWKDWDVEVDDDYLVINQLSLNF